MTSDTADKLFPSYWPTIWPTYVQKQETGELHSWPKYDWVQNATDPTKWYDKPVYDTVVVYNNESGQNETQLVP